MTDHDAAPGPLTACQICGSADLFQIIDLGHQPLCDSLLTKEQLSQPEVTYPLALNMCRACGLAQLSYVVDGSTVYHPAYPYRSGISAPLAVYQRQFAADVCDRLGVPSGSLVVDIGSNDGTLLSGFKALGMRVCGVEPTDIWKIAWDSGINTLHGRFTEHNAIWLRDGVGSNRLGPAQIITATNVFAHMADLGEVMRGIDALLAPDGVFITESHYLLDVLEKNQFDTIYHEHIRTYSLRSLCVLFEQYGMEVFDVQRADRYGGNIRAYVARKGTRPVAREVHDLLRHEENVGLFDQDVWAGWWSRVYEQRDRMQRFLRECVITGSTIAGKSCPGRSSTLINWYGITPDHIPYLAELPDSLKLGMYLPGKHIPVVHEQRIFDEQPDYLVLLSWHYADPIMKRLREAGYRGKFVMPLPEFQIID
jgi:SAM-dependent methyltransferase